VFSHDLPALNELMHKTGVPELTVPSGMPAGSGVNREMGTVLARPNWINHPSYFQARACQLFKSS
jgi:hypothetical protein